MMLTCNSTMCDMSASFSIFSLPLSLFLSLSILFSLSCKQQRQNDKSSLESIFDSFRPSSSRSSSTVINDTTSQHFHELSYPQARTCIESLESYDVLQGKNMISLESLQVDGPLLSMYSELGKKVRTKFIPLYLN